MLSTIYAFYSSFSVFLRLPKCDEAGQKCNWRVVQLCYQQQKIQDIAFKLSNPFIAAIVSKVLYE